jgi:hypothetical protein
MDINDIRFYQIDFQGINHHKKDFHTNFHNSIELVQLISRYYKNYNISLIMITDYILLNTGVCPFHISV